MRMLAGLLLAAVMEVAAAEPQRLSLAFMVSSGAQRAAWLDLLARFAGENPDIQLTHIETEQGAYKRDFERMLVERDFDLVFWFGGERLRQAAERGLLQPLDDLVDAGQLARLQPATLDALNARKRLWAWPLSYYHWGLFYRRSLFAQHGLSPPTTWPQFVQVMQKLKAAGVTPIAVGSRSGWPAAAWFDYLNLRLNGLAFHRRLIAGQASFRDARAVKVFEVWGQMLDSGNFLPEGVDLEWNEVLPYLYHGRVGMVLCGAFCAAKIPPQLLADVDIFPFPVFDERAPRFEEAPLDVLVRPAGSRNTLAARRFIAFLAREESSRALLRASFQLPVFKGAEPAAEPLLYRGQAWLKQAAGISFHFDRDASAPIRDAGLLAFRAFQRPPHDRRAAIEDLHAAASHAR